MLLVFSFIFLNLFVLKLYKDTVISLKEISLYKVCNGLKQYLHVVICLSTFKCFNFTQVVF